jgi:Peptidase M15
MKRGGCAHVFTGRSRDLPTRRASAAPGSLWNSLLCAAWLGALSVNSLATGARAQSPDDQALLDLAAPKAGKPASKKSDAPAPNARESGGASASDKVEAARQPDKAGPSQPVAEADAAAGDAAESRRQRRAARHARQAAARQATGAAQSSSVKPEDVGSVPSPAAEKRAATESAVETLASDSSASAADAKTHKPKHTEHKPKAERAPKPAKPKTAYDLARAKWHAEAPPEMCAQFKATAIPDLVLQVQGKDLSYVLRPQSRRGGWDEAQLATAKEAFGSWPGGPTPHSRTLDLVYAATLHFGCPYVTLISGIRKDRGGSRHSHGLAADIVLPGVDDEELAAYFRAQGFVGVGTYPRSGFVHVDTRDQSFFWVDRSAPNQHGRVVQVRKEESAAVDDAARARGHAGFVNPPRLQKALRVRAVRKLKAHKARLERAKAPTAPNPAP